MASASVLKKASPLEKNNKEKERPGLFSGLCSKRSRVEATPSESSSGLGGNNVKTNSVEKPPSRHGEDSIKTNSVDQGHGGNNIKTNSVNKGVIPPPKAGDFFLARKIDNIKKDSVDKRYIPPPKAGDFFLARKM